MLKSEKANLSAVFSPIPFTPGILSEESPINPLHSTTNPFPMKSGRYVIGLIFSPKYSNFGNRVKCFGSYLTGIPALVKASYV